MRYSSTDTGTRLPSLSRISAFPFSSVSGKLHAECLSLLSLLIYQISSSMGGCFLYLPRKNRIAPFHGSFRDPRHRGRERGCTSWENFAVVSGARLIRRGELASACLIFLRTLDLQLYKALYTWYLSCYIKLFVPEVCSWAFWEHWIRQGWCW